MIKLTFAIAGALLVLAQPLSATMAPFDDIEEEEPRYQIGVDDGVTCEADEPVGYMLCMLATGVYHFGKWFIEDGYADAEREAKRLAEQFEREGQRLAEQAARETKRIGQQLERETKRVAVQVERETKRFGNQTERETKRVAKQVERETKRVGKQVASAFKFSF